MSDSIVAVGSLSSKSFAYKFLKKIEGHLYKNAKLVIVELKVLKIILLKTLI